MRNDVIQGHFPAGLVHLANAQTTPQTQAVQSGGARPGWVQARIDGSAPVQRRQAGPATPVGPPLRGVQHGHAIQLRPDLAAVHSGPGQPLPQAVRQKMEAAFGAAFGDVRVHVGPQAAALGALAFTRGSDIHFAPGRYNPYTSQGEQLLRHELAHVLQQRAGRVRNPFGSGTAVIHDNVLEAEAHRLAARASRPRTAQPKIALPRPARAPHRAHTTPQQRFIQRAITIVDDIMDAASEAGARFGASTWFSLNRGPRKQITWFGKGIQAGIGVQAKPGAGDECPACHENKSVWELDHINPWRQFAAAALAPSQMKYDGTDIWVDINHIKALYNDPQNLWWICKGCNRKKSDAVLDSWNDDWKDDLHHRGRDLKLPNFLGF